MQDAWCRGTIFTRDIDSDKCIFAEKDFSIYNCLNLEGPKQELEADPKGPVPQHRGYRGCPSVKQAKINGQDSVGRIMKSKVQRLLKQDMVAVMKKLQSRGEGMLAFQVYAIH